MCSNCAYDTQIVYSEPCILSEVVSYYVSEIESLRYWPQSELVSSKWISEHLKDSTVRIVEVTYDSKNRGSHHTLPGAVVLDWHEDIDQTGYEDPPRQNEKYDKLLEKIGVKDKKTTIVLYSDFNNWFAAIVFWIFKHLGNDNVKLLAEGEPEGLYS